MCKGVESCDGMREVVMCVVWVVEGRGEKGQRRGVRVWRVGR